jgi:DNA-binding NtrC family response regulator
MPANVLIVDDEESICWGLSRLLQSEGHEASVASSAEEALERIEQSPPDLIVMDVRLPGMDGLAAMRQLRSQGSEVPIVVITAFGNLETAVGAMKAGAIDYLPKPFDLEQAATVIRRALNRTARGKSGTASPSKPLASRADEELLGTSAVMQEVFKRIALVAPTDVSVLITGESGTGKELVARAIHRHSSRSDKPFIPVNLASLSPLLVESELFGHVRGAFTGADNSRVGLLELADGATVFFDEMGDIPPSVQVKLLRVLEQHEVTPVGDTRPRPCHFRMIAATNRDLVQCLHEGTFRRDLYFRLASYEIALPALRERPEDIPQLTERFLRTVNLPQGPATITRAAMEDMQRRPWPGNVRELRNAVEHAAIMARGLAIGPEHLPASRDLDARPAANIENELRSAVRNWAAARLAAEGASGHLYEQFLQDAEPALFDRVLESTLQNRAAAAEILGIHRATLRKKMQ